VVEIVFFRDGFDALPLRPMDTVSALDLYGHELQATCWPFEFLLDLLEDFVGITFQQCARSKFDQGVKTTTESPSQVSNTGWNLPVVENFRYCHSGTLQSLGYQKRQVGSCCKEEASRKNERWHLIQIHSSWASYSNPRWNKE